MINENYWHNFEDIYEAIQDCLFLCEQKNPHDSGSFFSLNELTMDISVQLKVSENDDKKLQLSFSHLSNQTEAQESTGKNQVQGKNALASKGDQTKSLEMELLSRIKLNFKRSVNFGPQK